MSSDPARLTALGNQLIAVHIRLRDELDRLLDDLEGGERPRELRAHCLAFCSALDRHHTGEDGGLFPVLAAEHPELREVLKLLQRDHDVVAGILRSIEGVLDRAGADPGPDATERARRELDGLAAILESHFGYEERRLVTVLNELGADVGLPGTEAVFTP